MIWEVGLKTGPHNKLPVPFAFNVNVPVVVVPVTSKKVFDGSVTS